MRLYLLPVAVLPVVALACFDRLGDDPQFDGGVVHFDGGTFDVTIPDGGLPDVAQPDASVDAGPLPVKVLVLRGGLPEPNVSVVFQDASGGVVETKTTAADGTASRLVDAGTMVTVALGGGAQRRLLTVLGVKPGDVLTAIDDPVEAFRFDAVTAAVPANPPTSASTFQSHAGACTSLQTQTGPTSFNVSPPSCEQHGKFPVLTLALDSASLPVGFAFKKGNTLAVDGGTTQVTGLSAWAMPGTVALTATNASASNVFLGYTEIADGVPYSTATQGPAVAGTLARTFATYPGYADAVQLSAGQTALVGTRGAFTANTSIAKRSTPPAAATASIDLAQLLPAFTDLVDDLTDAARPAETLSFATAPTGADGLVVQMAWSVNTDSGLQFGQWIVVAPPTTTVVKAPALPPSLAAWAPNASSTFDMPSALLLDSDALAGYDALRPVAASFPAPNAFAPTIVLVPPLPVNGTVRISSITPAPM